MEHEMWYLYWIHLFIVEAAYLCIHISFSLGISYFIGIQFESIYTFIANSVGLMLAVKSSKIEMKKQTQTNENNGSAFIGLMQFNNWQFI